MQTYQSALLNHFDKLLHGFSTKSGGFSTPPYTGNNLAYHVNDDPDIVRHNHEAYAKFLNYPFEKLVRMDQVHGNKIVTVDKRLDPKKVPQCDALITNQLQTPLMVMVADCLPILMYDPINQAIAAVHAGRAGIFSKIVPLCIEQLQLQYQTSPEDLIVVAGPAIHSCCYEVGEEIVNACRQQEYYYAIESKNNSHYLDLVSILRSQLKNAGIKDKHIDISSICTSCHKDTFYSYRAENNTCGRFSGVIMLK